MIFFQFYDILVILEVLYKQYIYTHYLFILRQFLTRQYWIQINSTDLISAKKVYIRKYHDIGKKAEDYSTYIHMYIYAIYIVLFCYDSYFTPIYFEQR